MPTGPLIHFMHDETWPTGAAAVFMTANFVWGPLVSSTFAPFFLALYVLTERLLNG